MALKRWSLQFKFQQSGQAFVKNPKVQEWSHPRNKTHTLILKAKLKYANHKKAYENIKLIHLCSICLVGGNSTSLEKDNFT